MEKPSTELRAGQVVLQAVVELVNSGQQASRQRISSVTGLKLKTVDDTVKRLVDDGKLIRVHNGVFEPAETWPAPRAISLTILATGLLKIEVDDTVLELSPPERRLIAQYLEGSAAEARSIRAERETAQDASEVRVELVALRRQVKDLKRLALRTRHGAQPELFPHLPAP